MAQRDVRIRYSAEGGREVEEQARRIGDAGDRHLARIAAAAKPASAGLLALDSAARQARGGLDGMAASLGPIGRLAAGIGPLGLAMAAAGGGALALGREGAKAAAEIAAIGDAADRLQVDPDLFERLGAALTISGQSDQGLEAALRTLQNQLGNAQSGAKEAQRAFAELGVGIGGDLPAVIEQIADGFARIEEPAARAAAAQRLFGEQGGALLSILAQGGEGFRALGDEAEKLGALYGGDLIRDSQRLTAELATQEKLVNTRLNAGLQGFAFLWLDVKSAIADAGLALRGFLDGFRDLERVGISELDRRIKSVDDRLSRMGEPSNDSAADFNNFQIENLQRERRELLAERDARLSRESPEPSTVFRDAAVVRPTAAGGKGGRDTNANAFDREIEAAERTLAATQQQIETFGQAESAVAAYRLEQELLNAALEQFGTVSDASRDLARVYAADLQTAREQLEAMTKAQREQSEAARRAERDVEGLADIFTRFGQSLETSSGRLRATLQLLGEFASQALGGTGLIGNAVNAGLGQASGGLIGALFSPSAPAAAGAAFGADFRVGGGGGFDSRMLRIPVTPGERVQITPPGGGQGFDERAMARALARSGRDDGRRGSRFELSRASLAADLGAVLNRGGRLA